MVLTCCALHNLCEDHYAAYDPSWAVPAVDQNAPLAEGAQREEEEQNVRDALVHYLAGTAYNVNKAMKLMKCLFSSLAIC